MKTSMTSKKRIPPLPFGVLIGLVVVLFVNMIIPASANMDIRTKDSKVRIMVGSTSSFLSFGYEKSRNVFLTKLSVNTPDEVYSAVVPMNDYYSESEILRLVETYGVQLERLYVWEPGETGKLSLSVENNDVPAAKERFITKMDSHLGNSDGIQEKLDALVNGDLKIYAITVSGPAKTLKELSEEASMCAFVDVKYNPRAESYALKKNMPYSYIELPDKPDGAS